MSYSLNELCCSIPAEENGFWIPELAWHGFRANSEATNTLEQFLPDRLIKRCDELCGGLAGKRILELGPFEGKHTVALSKLAAEEIVSVEANPYNFIKCLIVKQYFDLENARFLLGDFVKYLENNPKKFDFILVAGVLYHLAEPLRTLDLVLELTDSIGICTTVYKEDDCPFRLTGRTLEFELAGQPPIVLHERTNAIVSQGKKHGIAGSAWLIGEKDLKRFLEHRGFRFVDLPCVRTPDCGPRIRLFAARQ